MSIHEILKQDTSYHFIEAKNKGINYYYASNINEDEIFSIIKYTIPLEIEKAFNTPLRRNKDTIYIQFSYEKECNNNYFLTISLADSKDYNRSHTEVLRIVANNINKVIDKYIEVKNNKKFTIKTINALNGCPVELPIYVIEKKN